MLAVVFRVQKANHSNATLRLQELQEDLQQFQFFEGCRLLVDSRSVFGRKEEEKEGRRKINEEKEITQLECVF